MSEKGIIFCTELVPKVLNGSKTMTRRNPGRYHKGDVLWIKETYHVQFNPQWTDAVKIRYKADGTQPPWESNLSQDKWSSSMFMAKKYSRPDRFLVTAVRQKPLGTITEADARAEGADSMWVDFRYSYIVGFIALWERINKCGSWERDKNKPVDVITFRRIEP